MFLQNCRQNVIAMLDALDRGDFETVESLGHGIKGAGGSYGFQAISDIGAALEQAAESADADASRRWVGELSRYPGSCRDHLRLAHHSRYGSWVLARQARTRAVSCGIENGLVT